MSEWNKSALVSLRGDLKLYVNVGESGMIDKLEKPSITSPEALGFLSAPEMRQVRALKANYSDQMDKIIEYLQGKEDTCFGNFCSILNNSGHEVWSKQLRKKAEDLRKIFGKFLHITSFCMHMMQSCIDVYFFLTFITVSEASQDKKIKSAPPPPVHDADGEIVHLHLHDACAAIKHQATLTLYTLCCNMYLCSQPLLLSSCYLL